MMLYMHMVCNTCMCVFILLYITCYMYDVMWMLLLVWMLLLLLTIYMLCVFMLTIIIMTMIVRNMCVCVVYDDVGVACMDGVMLLWCVWGFSYADYYTCMLL